MKKDGVWCEEEAGGGGVGAVECQPNVEGLCVP